MFKIIKSIIVIGLMIFILAGAIHLYMKYVQENKILKQIISRLEADSRIAEVLVTGVTYDEKSNKTYTTIKFLEYDTKGAPLEPRYFTFAGNIIQFQSLVVRFGDIYVSKADKLRGKSVYLFWRVFMLDGKNTQEYDIVEANEIPRGYKLYGVNNPFEKKIWENFWRFALDPREAKKMGIKNAQIEAPGTMFIPGMLYTIKIENDGGMRIDASPLPQILKGERIPR